MRITQGGFMNRDEILEKSRKENRDEGIECAVTKGREWGYVIACLICVFVGVFDLYCANDSRAFWAVTAIFMGFLATEGWSRYRFEKKWLSLINTVVLFIGCILALLNYVFKTMGIKL